MDFDIIVKGGTLPDGRTCDIGIVKDRIAAVEPEIPVTPGVTVDAHGCLVSPPFVDCHFHMDATLSYGIPRINASGTLLEGIALWGELKPLLTHEAVARRALAYCDWAVAMGLLAIRTHVDVCDDRLLAVEALLDVKKKVAPYLDLQLVAFPQDGYFRSDHGEQNTLRALNLGVDVVGGIPHFERTMEDGRASVQALCELAAARGLLVNMHCDETDDPLSRHVETLAHESLAARVGRPCRGLASHFHAFHGQLLCFEAVAADGRSAAGRHPQSADQHRHPGPPRHLSETARHDAGAGDAGARPDRRLRPGLRARSVVSAG